jgi:hypothetical protein
MHGFYRTVNHSANFSNVRLPSSVASSVRMADFNTKGNAFAANIAFCHVKTPPKKFAIKTNIFYHNFFIIASIF